MILKMLRPGGTQSGNALRPRLARLARPVGGRDALAVLDVRRNLPPPKRVTPRPVARFPATWLLRHRGDLPGTASVAGDVGLLGIEIDGHHPLSASVGTEPSTMSTDRRHWQCRPSPPINIANGRRQPPVQPAPPRMRRHA